MPKDAIAQYYDEDNPRVDPHQELHRHRFDSSTPSKTRPITKRLLKRELWNGQDKRGGNLHMPPQSRQIRARCALVPRVAQEKPPVQDQPSSYSSQEYSASTSERQDIVLFVSVYCVSSQIIADHWTDAILALGTSNGS